MGFSLGLENGFLNYRGGRRWLFGDDAVLAKNIIPAWRLEGSFERVDRCGHVPFSVCIRIVDGDIHGHIHFEERMKRKKRKYLAK
jgi:hypothetical protein